MKLTLIFSAIALMLFTACDSAPSDSGTTEPSTSMSCVITVEGNEILATKECDLDGDGVDQ
jgi:hypothetical protein